MVSSLARLQAVAAARTSLRRGELVEYRKRAISARTRYLEQFEGPSMMSWRVRHIKKRELSYLGVAGSPDKLPKRRCVR